MHLLIMGRAGLYRYLDWYDDRRIEVGSRPVIRA